LFKTAILNATKLHFPNYDLPWVLRCDASQFAVGAVIYQEFILPSGEIEHQPIAFSSKRFSELLRIRTIPAYSLYHRHVPDLSLHMYACILLYYYFSYIYYTLCVYILSAFPGPYVLGLYPLCLYYTFVYSILVYPLICTYPVYRTISICVYIYMLVYPYVLIYYIVPVYRILYYLLYTDPT